MKSEVSYGMLALLLAVVGCGSSESDSGPQSVGGTSSSASTGGAANTGGSKGATGGTTNQLGSTVAGGAMASGGQNSSGGVGSTAKAGSAAVGGSSAAATGGKSATGGSKASGGTNASSTGGSKASGGGSSTPGGSSATSSGGSNTSGGSGQGTGGNTLASLGGATGTVGGNGGATAGGNSGTAAGGNGGTAAGGNGGAATGGSGGAGGGTASDAVPSEGCNQTRKLQDGNQNITSGGTQRKYYVKAPKSYDSTHPYRVVFQYHWNYGSINAIVNPPDADRNTDRPFYGMEDLSGDTTIYVVPEGLENGWANTGDRDTKLTDDIYSAVTKGLCVDTTRVFTTGFSYGGAISLKLACTRPDKFRAALVYDTGTFLSGFNQSECKTPIAFFDSHGLDDQTFKYDDQGMAVLGIFTKLNGCTAQTPPKAGDNAHVCISFEGCSAGHPVRFCNFGKGENNPKSGGPGGHYPSPKDPGETTSWVPAEAWKFLTQF